ncbi:hypothetical protein C8R45DRAFT_942770 [Mycena sanguinolenta]|nr:hypothetical protein C8R45DRAFT_942770 [Mycena sanguinolenta]
MLQPPVFTRRKHFNGTMNDRAFAGVQRIPSLIPQPPETLPGVEMMIVIQNGIIWRASSGAGFMTIGCVMPVTPMEIGVINREVLNLKKWVRFHFSQIGNPLENKDKSRMTHQAKSISTKMGARNCIRPLSIKAKIFLKADSITRILNDDISSMTNSLAKEAKIDVLHTYGLQVRRMVERRGGVRTRHRWRLGGIWGVEPSSFVKKRGLAY